MTAPPALLAESCFNRTLPSISSCIILMRHRVGSMTKIMIWLRCDENHHYSSLHETSSTLSWADCSYSYALSKAISAHCRNARSRRSRYYALLISAQAVSRRRHRSYQLIAASIHEGHLHGRFQAAYLGGERIMHAHATSACHEIPQVASTVHFVEGQLPPMAPRREIRCAGIATITSAAIAAFSRGAASAITRPSAPAITHFIATTVISKAMLHQ